MPVRPQGMTRALDKHLTWNNTCTQKHGLAEGGSGRAASGGQTTNGGKNRQIWHMAHMAQCTQTLTHSECRQGWAWARGGEEHRKVGRHRRWTTVWGRARASISQLNRGYGNGRHMHRKGGRGHDKLPGVQVSCTRHAAGPSDEAAGAWFASALMPHLESNSAWQRCCSRSALNIAASVLMSHLECNSVWRR
jgi:hypothetical protein